IDGQAPNANNGWAVSPETGKDHIAVFETKTDLKAESGIVLRITLNQQYQDNMHTLGKFRLSVTAAARPLDLGTPRQLTEVIQIAKDKRTPEQNAEITKFFRDQDPELKKLQQALAQARQPRPVDSRLKE